MTRKVKMVSNLPPPSNPGTYTHNCNLLHVALRKLNPILDSKGLGHILRTLFLSMLAVMGFLFFVKKKMNIIIHKKHIYQCHCYQPIFGK